MKMLPLGRMDQYSLLVAAILMMKQWMPMNWAGERDRR